MKWRAIVAAAAAFCVLTTEASASDLYFHRPGATWEEYQADVNYCLGRIEGTTGDHNAAIAAIAATILYGPFGGIVAAGQSEDQRVRFRQLNLTYCMATRNWTSVELDTMYPRQRDPMFDTRFQAWFSQPTPPVGEVVFSPVGLVREEISLPPTITAEQARRERIEYRRSTRN